MATLSIKNRFATVWSRSMLSASTWRQIVLHLFLGGLVLEAVAELTPWSAPAERLTGFFLLVCTSAIGRALVGKESGFSLPISIAAWLTALIPFFASAAPVIAIWGIFGLSEVRARRFIGVLTFWALMLLWIQVGGFWPQLFRASQIVTPLAGNFGGLGISETFLLEGSFCLCLWIFLWMKSKGQVGYYLFLAVVLAAAYAVALASKMSIPLWLMGGWLSLELFSPSSEASTETGRWVTPVGIASLSVASLLPLLPLIPTGHPAKAANPSIAVLYNENLLTFERVKPGDYVMKNDACFGELLAFMEREGFRVQQVKSPDAANLAQADILLIINPTVAPTAAEKQSAEEFVRGGGALMMLTDHTDIGGVMKPTNEWIGFSAIRSNFDSAIPFDRNTRWVDSLVASTIAPFAFRSNSSFHISVGASLAIGVDAFPLISAIRGFSDKGDPNRGVSRLGNMLWTPDEVRDGLVLAAQQKYGKGVVQVWGDTSGFQDGNLPLNGLFIKGLFQSLAESRPLATSRKAELWLTPLLTLVGLMLLVKRPLVGFAVYLVAAAGVLACFVFSPWRQAALSANYSYLDRSLNSVYPGSARPDGLYRLSEGVARLGDILVAREFEDPPLDKANRVVLVAPTRDISEARAKAYFDYLNAGGHVIVCAGAAEAEHLDRLLKPLDLKVTDELIGAAHNSRIVDESFRKPLAKIIAEQPKEESYDAELPMVEAYGIKGSNYEPLVRCWGRDIIVRKRVGKGLLDLISDSRFPTSRNLGEMSINEVQARFLEEILK